MSVSIDNPEAVPASLIGRLLDWLDWKVNPVLLRDLRLYGRGKLALIGYFLTLATLTLLAILYALMARFEERDGRSLLAILTVLLAVICGALVPSLVFERFRSELGNRATELALMSPLTPARLVRGKLLGAWCLSLLVVCTAAPMLATAYLLGGVNLFTVLGCVGGVAMAGLVMPTPQLFMATQRSARGLSRGVAGLVFAAQLIAMIAYGYYLVETFAETSRRPAFEYGFLAGILAAGVLIGQFLYFVTVGRLRGEAEGRDAAPRLSLAFAAYAGGAAGCLLVHLIDVYGGYGHGPDLEEVVSAMGILVSFAFCLGFLILSYSNPVPPRNLREAWRDRPIRSLLLLPGFKPLSAYFLLNAIVVLAAAFRWTYFAPDDADRDVVRFACMALAPFMAVAIGMVSYRYLVMPLFKSKRGPALLPVTIILSNIALAIAAIFALILTQYTAGKEDLYALVLASNPVGILIGAVESWRVRPDVVRYGAVFLGLLLAALLPSALGRWDRGESGGGEGGHAPD